MKLKMTSTGAAAGAGCGGCALPLIVYFCIGLVGHYIINYDCQVLIGKTPPTLVSWICGIILWGPAFFVMIVCWLLQACGVHAPIFHLN